MKRQPKSSPLIFLIPLGLALCFMLFPLAQKGFFLSDDGDWMIIRLSAFYQALREGQFPVRFLGRLNNSYGYPVANFLYPGFLYIGSAFHAAGASFVDSVKIILAGSVAGSALFIYAWLSKYYEKTAAVIGAISFVFLPYIGFDLYTRGSVGELLAIFFASMAFYAAAWNRRTVFTVALASLVLAHNSLALIFVSAIVMFLVYEKKFMFFLYPMALAMGMSAFFWFPALTEHAMTVFRSLTISDYRAYFVTGTTFSLLGSSLFFIVFPTVRATKNHRMWFFVWLSFVAILLAMPVTDIIWRRGLLPQLFQFPFRFLSVLAISVPFLAAQIYEGGSKRYRILVVVIMCVVWALDSFHVLSRITPTAHDESYYTTNEATTTVRNEYMPRWVTAFPEKRDEERIIIYTGKGFIDPPVYTRHAFTTTVTAVEDSVVQINTIYYPGWGVAVDGQWVEMQYDNPLGLMRFPIAVGSRKVQVAFRETPVRFVIDCVSLVSAIMFMLFTLRGAKKGI